MQLEIYKMLLTFIKHAKIHLENTNKNKNLYNLTRHSKIQ